MYFQNLKCTPYSWPCFSRTDCWNFQYCSEAAKWLFNVDNHQEQLFLKHCFLVLLHCFCFIILTRCSEMFSTLVFGAVLSTRQSWTYVLKNKSVLKDSVHFYMSVNQRGEVNLTVVLRENKADQIQIYSVILICKTLNCQFLFYQIYINF